MEPMPIYTTYPPLEIEKSHFQETENPTYNIIVAVMALGLTALAAYELSPLLLTLVQSTDIHFLEGNPGLHLKLTGQCHGDYAEVQITTIIPDVVDKIYQQGFGYTFSYMQKC
jgi:hypothetical protein